MSVGIEAEDDLSDAPGKKSAKCLGKSVPDRTRTCDPGLEDRGAIQVSYGRADHSRSVVRR